jgi:regulator of protease activity HflC (stomatin/prohibitin superfamily)
VVNVGNSTGMLTLRKTLTRPSVLLAQELLSTNTRVLSTPHNYTVNRGFHTTRTARYSSQSDYFDNRRAQTSGGQFHLGIVIVPQGEKWIVERLGKYRKTLESGIHLLVPVVDRVAYKHSVKEMAYEISKQTAITKDNVQIHIDGIVYFKVEDPYKASYEIEDYFIAITSMAQTTMRAEIGKITLDKTFEERQNLNREIVDGIDKVAKGWGVDIKRYEIRDITVPAQIKLAMDLEAEAERKKRKTILDSQAEKESQENLAQGKKISTTLISEANMIEEMNVAKGEAFGITVKAEAQAQAIRKVAEALTVSGGDRAVVFRVAESYIESFGKLAQRGNTIIIPANVNDTVSMVTQATTIFDKLRAVTNNNSAETTPKITREQAIERLTDELNLDRSQLTSAIEQQTATQQQQPQQH